MIAWLSIKNNERNRNVYLGKECAQMYTMKSRANEPTFSKNERKCAATVRNRQVLVFCSAKAPIYCTDLKADMHLLFVHDRNSVSDDTAFLKSLYTSVI